MLNKTLFILSFSFTTSIALAHSLEGAWQVQAKTCYTNGKERPCQESIASKIEISTPTVNSVQKFCIKKIDSTGSTLECVNSYNSSENGATSYADLWVDQDSIHWRALYKDSITNDIERKDIEYVNGTSALFTELRFNSDPYHDTTADMQIEYKLVR